MANNQPIILSGYIFAYFEQGWEGRVEYAFKSDNSELFIILETGDNLVLYGKDGSILFQGEVIFSKRYFWQKHKLEVDIWSFVKQKDVSYAKWMQWFWQKPNLKAELIKQQVVK